MSIPAYVDTTAPGGPDHDPERAECHKCRAIVDHDDVEWVPVPPPNGGKWLLCPECQEKNENPDYEWTLDYGWRHVDELAGDRS